MAIKKDVVSRKILVPVNNIASSEHAADQIRNAIIKGLFKPGDRLIEKNLTDELNVSRHPIREALRRLSQEGLVEVRPNRGAVVAKLEPANILEVYAIRSALGELALKAFHANPKLPAPDVIKALEKMANAAVKLARQENQQPTIQNDLEFQETIVAASGLARCARYFAETTVEVQRFNNLTGIVYTERESDAINYVVGLLDAIKARDIDKALLIWKDKFAKAVARYMALLEKEQTAANNIAR
ncbi:GntR family transcriptional regulator [Gibbsiella quercinecans]|uniref:GntR family transcriptional regulator n=1 Tax=Gibbsiella quercinecans TaxID=929813 RepID=UPI003A4E3A8B